MVQTSHRPYLHAVFVYAPGAVKPARKIEAGLHYPVVLALDPAAGIRPNLEKIAP